MEVSVKNQSANRSNNHFVDRVRDTLLRGGRVTKWKGRAASFAPSLGISVPKLMSPVAALVFGFSTLAAPVVMPSPVGSGFRLNVAIRCPKAAMALQVMRLPTWFMTLPVLGL